MSAAYEILDDQGMDSDAWHDARRGSLGASEVAAVLGLSKWQTPLAVYNAKNGRPTEIAENLAYWGHHLEDAIARWVVDYHPEVGKVRPGFSARSVAWPWLTATPDRIAVADGAVIPLELKTSSAYSKGDWADGVPAWYNAQVQAQIAVLGAPYGLLAVLHGGNEAELHRIERDDPYIGWMIGGTRRFWQEHVEAGIPPLPSNTDETVDLWPGDPDADAIEGGDELFRAWIEYGEQQFVADAAARRLEELKLDIQTRMADAPAVTYSGNRLFTWAPRKGAARIDTKALVADLPDLAAEYTRVSAPTRTFKRIPAKESK
jgi:putative phage-type endonuclease